MLTTPTIYCLLLAIVEVPNVQAKSVRPIGVEAKLEDYPFLVHLSVTYPWSWTGEFKPLPFAGTYIKPSWVLTAAMVLRNVSTLWMTPLPDDAVECRMGLTQADPDTLKTVPAIKSKKLFTHPEFKLSLKFVLEVNVGLIYLKEPFELSETIGTIDLPTKAVDYDGKKLTIVGYSGIFNLLDAQTMEEFDKFRVPADHMKLRILRAQSTDCIEGLDDQICIGRKGESSSWAYDVGGPLIYKKRLVAIAVPNWSAEDIKHSVTYQILFPYKDWIDSSISGKMAGKLKTSDSPVQRHRAIPIVYFNLAVVYLIKFT